MIYSNEELKKYYKGAYSFREKDGWLQAFQYNEAQMEYFRKADPYWYERCFASSAKTIEAITSAREISLEYKIIWQGSLDSFELWKDGEEVNVYRIENLLPEGTLRFCMPEDDEPKRITIYLPVDATVLIRNLSSDEELLPVGERKKVLWMGDSITQGYGPLRSAYTCVSVANRILDYDIINQGIGGYIYDKGSVLPMDGYRPEEIIVALGTNQYMTKDLRPVRDFYEQIQKVYGSEIPVTAISPIWRGDFENDGQREDFLSYCEGIRKIVKSYPNIRLIDGFNLVEHDSKYYVDDLHPNREGAEMYGNRLAQAILN